MRSIPALTRDTVPLRGQLQPIAFIALLAEPTDGRGRDGVAVPQQKNIAIASNGVLDERSDRPEQLRHCVLTVELCGSKYLLTPSNDI